MSAPLPEPNTFIAIASSAFVGVGTGLFAFFARPYYWWVIDYLESDLTDKLRRLHIPTGSVRNGLVAWSIVLALTVLSFWLLAGSLTFAVLGSLLIFCGPWWILRRMAERHREKIEDQLADSMVSLSSSIRAGLSLAQAIKILADNSPKPIKAEFSRIVGEYEMGKPLDRTLDEAKNRLRSENFALFAAAMLASRESGGRLNETVDRIAHSVRELQRLERKVQADTAMARKSAMYMAITPVIILIVYFFVDRVAIISMFTTLPGQLLLAVAIMLNITAYLWACYILNPDI
jgi:tight adherence protein B